MDWLICIVVIFDVLNTIFRGIIRLIMSNVFTFALVVFGILFMAMLALIIIINLIKFKCSRDEPNITRCEKGMRRLIVFLQSVAVCCYFFGDNFYYVMNRYGEDKCEENCIQASYYVAVGFSGCGIILYAVVKVLQLARKDNAGRSKAKEEWINFLPMIAVIAEMDLLYTIASSELTGTGEDVASSLLLGIAILIGMTLIIGKASNLCKNIYKWNHPIQTVPIDTWIGKLSENPVEDIGQWNINDTWRSLHDQLSDNKFILMKGDVDNNNDANIEEIQAAHSNNVNTIRRNLATIQNNLATAQGTLNVANPEANQAGIGPTQANLNNLRDSLNTLKETLTTNQDLQILMITNWYRYQIVAVSIIISFPLMFQTLGDNLEPLDSIITCNTTVNSTVNEDSCETNSIIRLVLASVSLVIISSIALYCFINWLKSLNRPRTQDEMEQWVQYKQNNLKWWQRLCCWRCYNPPAHGNASVGGGVGVGGGVDAGVGGGVGDGVGGGEGANVVNIPLEDVN